MVSEWLADATDRVIQTEPKLSLVWTDPHGAQLARFNLSWILQGEVTGDGELPKPLQGGK